MTRKYRTILLGIVVMIKISIISSPYLKCVIMPQLMEKREMSFQSRTNSDIQNQLLWFSYKDGNIALNYHPILQDKIHNVMYLDKKGSSHEEPGKTLEFSSIMSGSFLVLADNLKLDINGDGNYENIFLCAKTDTNETQGKPNFSTKFKKSNIPIEIIVKNKTSIFVLVYGKPYTGPLSVKSRRGLNKEFSVKSGNISFIDVRDLREGIVVTCKDSQNCVLIGSYIQEKHTLFTLQHAKVMIPFFFIIISVAINVSLICIFRRKIKKVYSNFA
ncbi:hypothetical protein [Anaerosacchariphilus polymeriproducens]|uniref:Uncharacterized protein n=1 Tax=Anaerosacchariphilus polymeriproducens TaxID=1812858 RepID=A0A371AZT7_9FIRM|nr:hypothetical protein [Anaerosacchariphilus polymeriproducens]RDU25000.1 hypothetical protein DWV06_01875 [Anaerosacchariphilus polymeriproducens]